MSDQVIVAIISAATSVISALAGMVYTFFGRQRRIDDINKQQEWVDCMGGGAGDLQKVLDRKKRLIIEGRFKWVNSDGYIFLFIMYLSLFMILLSLFGFVFYFISENGIILGSAILSVAFMIVGLVFGVGLFLGDRLNKFRKRRKCAEGPGGWIQI
ncbi:hypothetical protein V5T06_04435 [Corynebacterium mastitidis]